MRWWADRSAALEALSKVDETDCHVGVGVALLGLHALGADTVGWLSRSTAVSKDLLRESLESTDVVEVAKAAGVALSGTYGDQTPSYVSQRVVQWKSDADDAALQMFDTLVAKGVAPPHALERVSAGYGLPPGPAMGFVAKVSAPMVPPIVVADAADRALQEWVATVADVEAEAEPLLPFSKSTRVRVEQFDTNDGIVSRQVARDDHGRFAPLAERAVEGGAIAPTKAGALRRRKMRHAAVSERPKKETAAQQEADEVTASELSGLLTGAAPAKNAVANIRARNIERSKRRNAEMTRRRSIARAQRWNKIANDAREENAEAILYTIKDENTENLYSVAEGTSEYLQRLPTDVDRFSAYIEQQNSAMAPAGEVTAFFVPMETLKEIEESGGAFTFGDLSRILDGEPEVHQLSWTKRHAYSMRAMSEGVTTSNVMGLPEDRSEWDHEAHRLSNMKENLDKVLFVIPSSARAFSHIPDPLSGENEEFQISPDAIFATGNPQDDDAPGYGRRPFGRTVFLDSFELDSMDSGGERIESGYPYYGEDLTVSSGIFMSESEPGTVRQGASPPRWQLHKADRSAMNPKFEALHPRDEDGQFAFKTRPAAGPPGGNAAALRRRKMRLDASSMSRRPQQTQERPAETQPDVSMIETLGHSEQRKAPTRSDTRSIAMRRRRAYEANKRREVTSNQARNVNRSEWRNHVLSQADVKKNGWFVGYEQNTLAVNKEFADVFSAITSGGTPQVVHSLPLFKDDPAFRPEDGLFDYEAFSARRTELSKVDFGAFSKPATNVDVDAVYDLAISNVEPEAGVTVSDLSQDGKGITIYGADEKKVGSYASKLHSSLSRNPAVSDISVVADTRDIGDFSIPMVTLTVDPSPDRLVFHYISDRADRNMQRSIGLEDPILGSMKTETTSISPEKALSMGLGTEAAEAIRINGGMATLMTHSFQLDREAEDPL